MIRSDICDTSSPSGPTSPKLWGAWATVLVLAVVGLLFCLILISSYSGGSSILESQWFCGSDQVAGYGCSGVFASRYGKFLGVPLPAIGGCYFLAIALWLIVLGRHAFNLLLAMILAPAAAISIGLLIILYYVLPGQCRWCLFVHICNFAIVTIGLIAVFRFHRSPLRLPWPKYLPKAVIVALAVACVFLVCRIVLLQLQLGQVKDRYVAFRAGSAFQSWRFQSQAPKRIAITSDDHVIGPPDAAVTIVVYKDFQCEYCKQAWTVLYDLYRRNYAAGGKVALVVRHWPFTKNCNPDVRANWHAYACAAAFAAEAAALTAGEEAFWKYHDLLLQNHDRLDRSPYLDLAETLGIDREAFTNAWRSENVRKKIQADVKSARELGIHGVPAILINGRHSDVAWRKKDLLKKLIDDQIPN